MVYQDLIQRLTDHDTRAAARLITLVENDIQAAEKIINSIYDKTGNAYILGITGAPGSGKSTFISNLTKIFIKQGKNVGIICVDPTSPLTGGALLGDRIRMKENFSLKNVFIRSMANRGQLGGLARATDDAIKILDVYGCDVIIVETVGVGQSEVDIFKSAQTVLVLVVPGLGDDIQAIKAGLMEITDIFIVNKMDIPGADKKEAEIRQMLELNETFKYQNDELMQEYEKRELWAPKILQVNSLTGENFDDLLEILDKHQKFLEESGFNEILLKDKIKNEILQILKFKIEKKIENLMETDKEVNELVEKVGDRELDPYQMADSLLKKFKEI
ncbi:MAG: methylmalonyl Co-A mutase-associated GTPase MeaB [Promethearchaeia archaeon]